MSSKSNEFRPSSMLKSKLSKSEGLTITGSTETEISFSKGQFLATISWETEL